jgi:hypothetical protein
MWAKPQLRKPAWGLRRPALELSFSEGNSQPTFETREFRGHHTYLGLEFISPGLWASDRAGPGARCARRGSRCDPEMPARPAGVPAQRALVRREGGEASLPQVPAPALPEVDP